jgi:hypothetical protein
MLEGAALLILGGMFARLAMDWVSGSKDGMWLLPLLAAGIYATISVLGGRPTLWNLPAGVDRNISEIQGVILRLLAVVKLAVMVVLAYISFTGISVSLVRSAGLGVGFLPAVLAVTAFPAVYYARKLRRLRQ